MDLKQAQEEFLKMIDSVHPSNLSEFLDWIKDSFAVKNSEDKCTKNSNERDITLMQIAEELRQMVPLGGTLESEKSISNGSDGPITVTDLNSTIHIDSFLYDDDEIDHLCDQGRFSRFYCKKCGSHETELLNLISHSCSIAQLKFLFLDLIPSLNGKLLVDIGSRLGAILYGAYLYTNARKIIGIEINSDFCSLSRSIIEKYNMGNRIQVLHDDFLNRADLVKQADVLILFNPFQFFATPEQQKAYFKFLKTGSKSGCAVVTAPSLKSLTEHLNLESDFLTDWVSEIDVSDIKRRAALGSSHDFEDLDHFHVYRVNVVQ